MNEIVTIIKTTIGQEDVTAVNARDLHEFLEIKTYYSTWIARQIEKYGFVINSDFSILKGATGAGGEDRKDYIISLDMAKELSMVENNEKGKQARQYFIECEKRLRTKNLVIPDFNNPAEAARAWALEYEEKQKALAMVERKKIALEEIIETRTWIQDKKVATAMATASAKSRENEKLKEQIGDSKTYKQVKAIPWLSEFFDLKNAGVYIALGNQLKKMSDAMRYPCRTLDDSRYSQGVKAYHIDVIEALRLKLITDLNMMRKYRI